eukprot:CAMPEP_0205855834 /NCGR_PEP_ID=MMETSP1083-20121108/2809_1 /ASSEMBLY_ACC=CAM_ASM_000430 /TAXON_ID=97485 /ORGANISM="Prymnesium parvum, Strain Texoma1" /LENGTH=92 /DNA_ID=CAMNT_0053217221 /DNA_START=471 /DNA_END=747 /DNA_ORIENTATION=+
MKGGRLSSSSSSESKKEDIAWLRLCKSSTPPVARMRRVPFWKLTLSTSSPSLLASTPTCSVNSAQKSSLKGPAADLRSTEMKRGAALSRIFA